MVASPEAKSKMTSCAGTALLELRYLTRYVTTPWRCCRVLLAAFSTLYIAPNWAVQSRTVSMAVDIFLWR